MRAWILAALLVGCGSGTNSEASGASDTAGAPDTTGSAADDVLSRGDAATTTDSGDANEGAPDADSDTSAAEDDTSAAADTSADSGCVNACPEPGRLACDGSALLECVADSEGCLDWAAPVPCDDDDPCTTNACASGACLFEPVDGPCLTTECLPSATRCSGDTFEECSADGSTWVAKEQCEFGCIEADGGAVCASCAVGESTCTSASVMQMCVDALLPPEESNCAAIDTCAMGACTGTIDWTEGDSLEDTLWWLTVHVGECWSMNAQATLNDAGLCWVMDTTWLPTEMGASDIRDWACAGIASGDIDDDFLLGVLDEVEAVLTCDAAGGNLSIGGGGALTTGAPLGDWCMIATDDGVEVVSCAGLSGW